MDDYESLRPILLSYFPEGRIQRLSCHGNGHINDTYHVSMQAQNASGEYILQKINRNVFKRPDEVMDNIIRVTEHLGRRIRAEGGDPNRQTLTLLKNHRDEYFYVDDLHDYWRMYRYLDNTVTLESTKDPELLYQAALAFGEFFCMLKDFPADTLHETIPDFHNTPERYRQLKLAVKQNAANRVKDVQSELDFVDERLHELSRLIDLKNNGALPVRVTHNDTKLNNVLLDANTHKGICVIDLDTVMPGLCAYDFGDSIRYGANTSDEDETDLEKCTINLALYEAYTEGFLEKAGAFLTKEEIETLPFAAKLITFELGVRFLADHINGDVYFKVHRPDHNLQRARNQFCLVREMEKKQSVMESVTRKLAGSKL